MAVKRHVVLPGSRRKKAANAVCTGKVDPKEKIIVTITLRGPKLPGPDEYVGKTMDPVEFADKFGAKQADADQVSTTLERFGLHVDSVSLPARSMQVSGTAAAIEAAFKPGMEMMRTTLQEVYRGRHGTIMIPVALKGIVTGIFGLDQRRMARRKSVSNRTAPKAGALSPLSPSDIEERYNFPKGDAAGQTIAIAEFGGGYFADDMAAYCTKFGLPIPNVQAISLTAPAYTLQEILALPPMQSKEELGNAVEVMLDVQVIAGLCPKANLSVYFSLFDERGWVDVVDKVLAQRPVTFSISWGLAEEDPNWSACAINAINDRLNALRLLGVTVCAAAGDDGSGDQIDDGRAHVDFPSSSPYVLAVGGTMLAQAGATIAEVCWWESPGRRTNKGGGATGGGVSTQFGRPPWQQNVTVKSLNPKSIDGRIVPDVAALAGDPLYDLVFRNHSKPNGGTSASAPLWAALVARIDAALPPPKRQRFLAPLFYSKSGASSVGQACSRDVTKGNNASHPKPGVGYQAGRGFNAVSGWGVPDGDKFLAALASI